MKTDPTRFTSPEFLPPETHSIQRKQIRKSLAAALLAGSLLLGGCSAKKPSLKTSDTSFEAIVEQYEKEEEISAGDYLFAMANATNAAHPDGFQLDMFRMLEDGQTQDKMLCRTQDGMFYEGNFRSLSPGISAEYVNMFASSDSEQFNCNTSYLRDVIMKATTFERKPVYAEPVDHMPAEALLGALDSTGAVKVVYENPDCFSLNLTQQSDDDETVLRGVIIVKDEQELEKVLKEQRYTKMGDPFLGSWQMEVTTDLQGSLISSRMENSYMTVINTLEPLDTAVYDWMKKVLDSRPKDGAEIENPPAFND